MELVEPFKDNKKDTIDSKKSLTPKSSNLMTPE